MHDEHRGPKPAIRSDRACWQQRPVEPLAGVGALNYGRGACVKTLYAGL